MTSSVFYQIRNLRSTASLSLMPLSLAILDPKEVVEPFPVATFLWYWTHQDPTRNGTRSIQNSLTFSYKTQVPFSYPVDFCKREKDAFSLYHTS